jgi:hypothetical protein
MWSPSGLPIMVDLGRRAAEPEEPVPAPTPAPQ